MTRVAPLFFVCCLASAAASAGPSGDKWAESPDDPNPTRLLVGPTARSLDQGQVYLDSFGISLPFVQVGITNRVSMGAGAPLLFPGVTPGDVFWLTPKVQVFRGEQNQAAVGVFHVKAGDEASGIAYGVMTHGAPDGAVTLGVGYTLPRETRCRRWRRDRHDRWRKACQPSSEAHHRELSGPRRRPGQRRASTVPPARLY